MEWVLQCVQDGVSKCGYMICFLSRAESKFSLTKQFFGEWRRCSAEGQVYGT